MRMYKSKPMYSIVQPVYALKLKQRIAVEANNGMMVGEKGDYLVIGANETNHGLVSIHKYGKFQELFEPMASKEIEAFEQGIMDDPFWQKGDDK